MLVDPRSRLVATRRRPDRRRHAPQRPGALAESARTWAVARTRASRTSGSAARAISLATTALASSSRPSATGLRRGGWTGLPSRSTAAASSPSIPRRSPSVRCRSRSVSRVSSRHAWRTAAPERPHHPLPLVLAGPLRRGDGHPARGRAHRIDATGSTWRAGPSMPGCIRRSRRGSRRPPPCSAVACGPSSRRRSSSSPCRRTGPATSSRSCRSPRSPSCACSWPSSVVPSGLATGRPIGGARDRRYRDRLSRLDRDARGNVRRAGRRPGAGRGTGHRDGRHRVDRDPARPDRPTTRSVGSSRSRRCSCSSRPPSAGSPSGRSGPRWG